MSYVVRERYHSSSPADTPYLWLDPDNPQVPQASGALLAQLTRALLDAERHYRAPISRQREASSEKFRVLARRWRRETGSLSSPTQIAMHPAYQQIIGMGQDALPFIVRELESQPDHWFWALRAIAGVNPIPPSHRGQIAEMVRDWLNWARREGIRW